MHLVRVDILTLFPDMFRGPLTESILQRAQDAKLLSVDFHDLRQYGLGQYHQVDDKPYGGGAGMLMRPDVIVKAIEEVTKKATEVRTSERQEVTSRRPDLKTSKPYRIYFSPRGKKLTQTKVERLASKYDWLLLVCGHYEGIDQRVIDGGFIDEEISIGDYVLTGGELPAMILIDAVARQIPGVLGKDESAQQESFSQSLGRKREYPHYTRPEEFRGLRVPDVLISGHHAEIEKWRKENTR